MIQIHDLDQGTDEWKELRAGKYTGSGAHKLLKFASSKKVVDGEVSSYSLAEITGFKGTFITRRGHALEDDAIKLYEAITKVKVERPGFVTNSKYPECGYSPDGMAPAALLEVKCFQEPEHMKLITGAIKLEVMAQVQFGLLITGRPYAHLLPYNPKFARRKLPDGTDNPDYDIQKAFKIITIKANPRALANMRRILANARKESILAL